MPPLAHRAGHAMNDNLPRVRIAHGAKPNMPAYGRRERKAQPIEFEERVRRGWLVQAAAYTRSWRLLRWAAGFVRIDVRPVGATVWRESPVRVVIGRDGSVRLVPA